ncbi:MAG: histidine phosphatase family protein [Alphaproteobacteria bacterium]|nr:histidine phosphatase family protein [Alphaproteobacteria bacterium]TAD89812.1 MAG: histidine phosphatase family protein [Alphaproteobacteria bacterium]
MSTAVRVLETRWWWIRHAPLVGPANQIPDADTPADLSDPRRSERLKRLLPARGLWITSVLPRAVQTAGALTHSRPIRDADLNEQDFGLWRGRTHDALWSDGDDNYRRFWAAPASIAPPEGESFEAMCLRVASAIERLTQTHAGMDVVCVAHAGTIRAALALALGLAPHKALSFVVEPWSLTRLDWVGGDWRIGRVNALP